MIKKNSSTLKNLLEWLKEHSAHQSTQMVSQPMLVIDDEADNASINTAYARTRSPGSTARSASFCRSFTAAAMSGTPPHPLPTYSSTRKPNDDALRQDLFPRHFIIGLDAPTNYFGAQKVFLDARDRHIRLIEDNEDVFPMKHKIDHPVDVLPGSLVQAVRAFIVSRAIRNARGQQAAHASMLINASRIHRCAGAFAVTGG